MNYIPRFVWTCVVVCLVTWNCHASDKPTATQPAGTAGSSEWSAPSEQGLQTRLVLVTRSVKPGKPVFVKMEVRHKDRKEWGQATIVLFYPAEVLLRDQKGKLVDHVSVALKFNTIVHAGEGMSIGVFLAGQKTATLRTGTYSVTIEPQATPELLKKGMVQLPVAGSLMFKIPTMASSAPVDEVLKPDYEQAEELKAYLQTWGFGYPELLINQGKSIAPGLVALVEKGDSKLSDESDLRLWQYAAFIIGKIGDKRAVPFLVKRLNDPGAMDFYFVVPLGQFGVKEAVPKLVEKLRTLDDNGWRLTSQAYGSKSSYLLEALVRITGAKFSIPMDVRDPRDPQTYREATLKAVNAWWDKEGKKLYETPATRPAKVESK